MCRVSYIHYFCIMNLAFGDDTHKQDEDKGYDFERKASNLDAKRKEEVN